MTPKYQSKPGIVSRNEWGAKPANSSGTTRTSTGKIVIHHCATDNATVDNLSESELMRIHQINHLNRPNYSDIAYHFAIGKNGTIFEGRREAARSYASNSNATAFDQDAIHIMIMGNYDERTMTSTQSKKLEDLIAWLCYKYNIDLNIKGHRDNPSSSSNHCPGSFNYAAIPSIIVTIAERVYGILIS